MLNYKVGFIGSGNMAHAIMKGIVDSRTVAPEHIYVFDIDRQKLESMKQEYGVNPVNNNVELTQCCDLLILAVKPYICQLVLDEINPYLRQEHMLVSIAAGWSPEELENVKVLFSANGLVELLDEDKMFATTGISGTIPACVSMYIEALADGGVANGLPRDFALRVAAQAVMGSAKMVLESGKHPGILKDQVCTPGGTTIEAVCSLEEDGFRGTVIRACNRCTKKSFDMLKK